MSNYHTKTVFRLGIDKMERKKNMCNELLYDAF